MKTRIILALFIAIPLLAGCGGTASTSTVGKWLDYGNGIVNLDHVTQITTVSNFNSGVIKFDEFSLTVSTISKEDTDALANIDRSDPNFMGKLTEADKVLKKHNDDIIDQNMSRIRDFLNSTNSYMKL